MARTSNDLPDSNCSSDRSSALPDVMPSQLGFFADVIRTGTVLGVDWTFSPDEVAQTFGMDPAINRHGQHLWHDYGLVEYFWEQNADGRWRGTHFSVQVHRLNNQRGYEIPQVIAEHGTPPPGVDFDALTAELTVPLVAVRSSDDDFNAFWQPDSTVFVFVVAENPSPVSHASTVTPGHVYRIMAPYYAPDVDLRGVASTGMGAHARHLLTLDEAGRRAWLDQQPAEALRTHNWWLHLFTHVDIRIREQPLRRPAWVELRLWLLSQAATAGVFDPRELAKHRARFVGGLYARAITTGLDSILPTADELIAACLAAIPVTPTEVTAIDDWRGETLDTMRRLRQAKNLINAAEYLPRPHDPKLATDLDRWIRLKPRLT